MCELGAVKIKNGLIAVNHGKTKLTVGGKIIYC